MLKIYGHKTSAGCHAIAQNMSIQLMKCGCLMPKALIHAGFREYRYEHSYHMMCSRFFGMLIRISKNRLHIIFCIQKERSRYCQKMDLLTKWRINPSYGKITMGGM